MADPRRPLAVLVNPAAAGGRSLGVLPDVQVFAVYADGDPIADLPVKIRAAERVLRVMVPAS